MALGYQGSMLDALSKRGPGELGDTVCRTELTSGPGSTCGARGWAAQTALFDRCGGRPMAERAASHVRPHCRRPASRLLLSEGEQLPDPVLDDAREAGSPLRRRARRAVPHGGALPLPDGGRQRRLARRHHRARQHPRTPWWAIVSRCAPGLAPAPEGWRHAIRHELGHATCWSWRVLPANVGARSAQVVSVTGARMSVQFRPRGCAEPQQRPAAPAP